MIARYQHLVQHPHIFQSLTGLRISEFFDLAYDVIPLLHTARFDRLDRPDRQRAHGGGEPAELDQRNQLLLAVVWLRCYPTNELLGYLFAVSDSTVSRVLARVVPVLAKSGNDTMRTSDPGRRHRLHLPQLLQQIPELAVIVDSFEQKVQRPQDRAEADRYYSGKKKCHTLKSQVAVNAKTGRFVAVSASVVGPMADYKLLEQSGLLEQLPATVGVLGDLAYVGLNKDLAGRGASPRRKPRGRDRPEEDQEYNRAFAKVRIVVEHSIGQLRQFRALSQTDRHHRRGHELRVQAVAGIINRRMDMRVLRYKLAA